MIKGAYCKNKFKSDSYRDNPLFNKTLEEIAEDFIVHNSRSNILIIIIEQVLEFTWKNKKLLMLLVLNGLKKEKKQF